MISRTEKGGGKKRLRGGKRERRYGNEGAGRKKTESEMRGEGEENVG